MYCVYRHIRLDKNEIFYIGIGSIKRAYSKYDRNKFWKNIVNKTEYVVEIMLNDLSWEEACKKEKEFIKLYGRKDLEKGKLVNMTDGGEGGFGLKHSDETKKKISLKRKGSKISEETKKKLSIIGTGKICKQETKDKISLKNKGKSKNKGYKHSAETIKILSEINSGENNPFFGKKHTEKTILKIAEANRNRSQEIKDKIREGNKKYWTENKEKRLQENKNKKINNG